MERYAKSSDDEGSIASTVVTREKIAGGPMVEKPYQWAAGATLEEHSKRKHKILHEYFARYMAVRCQLPQQERFRLAIVEGFAGAGRLAAPYSSAT